MEGKWEDIKEFLGPNLKEVSEKFANIIKKD